MKNRENLSAKNYQFHINKKKNSGQFQVKNLKDQAGSHQRQAEDDIYGTNLPI